MLPSTSRLALPLFVYLSLVLATLVQANNFDLKRDHTNLNIKRIIKKRQLGGLFGPGAQDDPTTASVSIPVASASASLSASASSSVSVSASASASASASSSASSSVESTASSTESVSQSSTTESSTESASSTASPAPVASPSETLNLTAHPAGPSNIVSTVNPIVTRTESGALGSQTTIPSPQSNTQKENSTTLTIIIGVAASLGGIAILWTVFRKWKLSSSKRFDQRLNPIDFQPTVSEGDHIHRRTLSNGSSRSKNVNASDRAIEQHDLTAGPMTSNVGGYADLARGGSPTQMSEQLHRGPSLNRDYDYGVPLHHQGGYGNASYNPRY